MKTALFERDSIYIIDILLLIPLPTYDNKQTETAFIYRDSIYIIGILRLIPHPTYNNKQTETALFTGTQNTLLAHCSGYRFLRITTNRQKQPCSQGLKIRYWHTAPDTASYV